jgi:hypothetical protein
MRKKQGKVILKDHEECGIHRSRERLSAGSLDLTRSITRNYKHASFTIYMSLFFEPFLYSKYSIPCLRDGLSVVAVSWEKYGQGRSVSKRIEIL